MAKYDVAIIGSGPGGYVAAIRAALVSGAFQNFKVLYDGTTYGFTQQVVVTKYSTNTVTKDRTTVAIELQSNGAPTFLP